MLQSYGKLGEFEKTKKGGQLKYPPKIALVLLL